MFSQENMDDTIELNVPVGKMDFPICRIFSFEFAYLGELLARDERRKRN